MPIDKHARDITLDTYNRVQPNLQEETDGGLRLRLQNANIGHREQSCYRLNARC